MKKDKTVVVTSKEDSHADYIINEINKLEMGDKVIRLNTEDFITNCTVSFTEHDFEIEIKDSDRVIRKEEIISVWFRRPKDFCFKTLNEKETAFIHKQSNALLRGIYFATHDTAKWINPLPSLHRARIKLQQLMLAKRLGFNVPKTIVSNSPDRVKRFIEIVDEISTKSLDEANFQSDKYVYPLFNRKLDKKFVRNNIAHISNCPTLLQEYIEKQSDIRVVVIGKSLFAFEILSQENIHSREDFRGVAPTLLKHRLIALPKMIEDQILAYMKHQQLIYSAFDFVCSKDNTYYFLENNPNGQWLWLELQTGVKISEALIKELFSLKGFDTVDDTLG